MPWKGFPSAVLTAQSLPGQTGLQQTALYHPNEAQQAQQPVISAWDALGLLRSSFEELIFLFICFS